ncbi:hypothetical protein IWQ60_012166 [Tieghemiomyces parasiticus]|uniref:Myb-like domain-containing protein n=1 Tax=Tieghemiomyces parasiticus TaxID=78921 RepID=A0A9W7ZLK1_9FUNG|nr:hypothetical protein IWQ60_012166 [Tieghemiomyces parasiticus]
MAARQTPPALNAGRSTHGRQHSRRPVVKMPLAEYYVSNRPQAYQSPPPTSPYDVYRRHTSSSSWQGHHGSGSSTRSWSPPILSQHHQQQGIHIKAQGCESGCCPASLNAAVGQGPGFPYPGWPAGTRIRANFPALASPPAGHHMAHPHPSYPARPLVVYDGHHLGPAGHSELVVTSTDGHYHSHGADAACSPAHVHRQTNPAGSAASSGAEQPTGVCRWSPAETQVLFRAVRAFAHEFDNTKRNGYVWQKVSQFLHAREYSKTAEQCRTKWKNTKRLDRERLKVKGKRSAEMAGLTDPPNSCGAQVATPEPPAKRVRRNPCLRSVHPPHGVHMEVWRRATDESRKSDGKSEAELVKSAFPFRRATGPSVWRASSV